MQYRLLTLLTLITGFFWPAVSYAQTAAADIQKAENYLRNLDTVKAEFIQKAHNGSRLSGTFYLDRPGKLRFEYNEVDDFIVADGMFIYFYDAELGEQTNAPIGQTLADFLLRDRLTLRGDVTVQNISRENGFKTITIVETSDPNAGSVKLFFKENPYSLRMWQVTDAAGLTTEIMLRDMQEDVDLPSGLFAYFAPKEDKPRFNQ
jgi:outer membrane lipoprotein-sorting protein